MKLDNRTGPASVPGAARSAAVLTLNQVHEVDVAIEE